MTPSALALFALLATAATTRADTLTVVDQVSALTNPQAAWVAQSVASGTNGFGYNTSAIVQAGNGNTATTDQRGSSNMARITQTGDGDMSNVQQTGSFGTVLTTQTGNKLGISVTQTGNAPSISITQTQTHAGR